MKSAPSFATLADEFRASLIDTSRIGYPLDVLEPDVRARSDAGCRTLIPHLQRAHRFVLDEDFTRLASRMARRSPMTLAKMLEIARLPFDELWLEWPQAAREESVVATNYSKDKDIPKRVGVLFWPVSLPARAATNDREINAYRALIVEDYPGSCGPTPVGLLFSMTDQIAPWRDAEDPRYKTDSVNAAQLEEKVDQADQERAAEHHRDVAPISESYMEAVRWTWPEQRGLASLIGSHATITYSPPFGPLHMETIDRARIALVETTDPQERERLQAIIKRQTEWLGLCTREISGLWRWIIAVFGLYNTGGGEFVFTDSRKQGRQGFRKALTGSLPAYEYRIVKVKRPISPEVVEKQLPATSSIGKREHTVEGSWHHRRLATAECAKHPKICERAIWQPAVDAETSERIGSDQFECQICHRHRWWMPKHTRGNALLGRIDKGYEVTATGSPHPSHRTVEVVETLPSGVRIKSLPRHEAVKQHERGIPDEH